MPTSKCLLPVAGRCFLPAFDRSSSIVKWSLVMYVRHSFINQAWVKRTSHLYSHSYLEWCYFGILSVWFICQYIITSFHWLYTPLGSKCFNPKKQKHHLAFITLHKSCLCTRQVVKMGFTCACLWVIIHTTPCNCCMPYPSIVW